MAGMGKRMRPHTLTVPKPLLPVAGKPIVQRLVEEISNVSEQPIDEIAYIIGDFGVEVEDQLKEIAHNLGAVPEIYYQEEALGTAHAIYCAEQSLEGNVVVAFADTLFKADFKLDKDADATIWVQRVKDPSAFGVVKLNDAGQIVDFVEKPQEFVSDLAIIGIYYFNSGEKLRDEIKYLIDNDIRVKGEFQLTDALQNLKNKGTIFTPGQVIEWMDCGNKNATVNTNKRILEYHKNDKLISENVEQSNSIIIEPCYIGKNVKIENSVIGPHLSVGDNTIIRNSLVRNSIVQKDCTLDNVNISNSMIGSSVNYTGKSTDVSVGDYTKIVE